MDISPLWSDCDHLDIWGALFGESLGRILVSTSPENKEEFMNSMIGVTCHYLGEVSNDDAISFCRDGEQVLTASMQGLRKSWKRTLHGGDEL